MLLSCSTLCLHHLFVFLEHEEDLQPCLLAPLQHLKNGRWRTCREGKGSIPRIHPVGFCTSAAEDEKENRDRQGCTHWPSREWVAEFGRCIWPVGQLAQTLPGSKVCCAFRSGQPDATEMSGSRTRGQKPSSAVAPHPAFAIGGTTTLNLEIPNSCYYQDRQSRTMKHQ